MVSILDFSDISDHHLGWLYSCLLFMQGTRSFLIPLIFLANPPFRSYIQITHAPCMECFPTCVTCAVHGAYALPYKYVQICLGMFWLSNVIHHFGVMFIHVQIFFDNPMPPILNTPNCMVPNLCKSPTKLWSLGVFHIRATQIWFRGKTWYT